MHRALTEAEVLCGAGPTWGACLYHPKVGTREGGRRLLAHVQTGRPWQTHTLCPLRVKESPRSPLQTHRKQG